MILGLTGGIATGKSTVAEFFREKKIPVICADTIAREITEKQEILDKISVEFGKEMIVNGKLDRKKMREYIFVDINRVKKLNEITHPPIIEKIKEEINKNKENPILVVDIPLLFEGNYEFLVEKILLITCKKEIQLLRVQKRDSVSLESAKNIISKQMSLDEKEKKSDFIIENNGTKEELYEEIEKFLIKISWGIPQLIFINNIYLFFKNLFGSRGTVPSSVLFLNSNPKLFVALATISLVLLI